MSRNFTTDVDTQREYFNATYFNNSGVNQIAKYDTTLLKPFFNDPDKWKLAINRMRVPLSGIPLTKNNIPFQQWEVGIDYRPVSSGAGGQVSESYVSQYNPGSTSGTYWINITPDLRIQKVDSNILNWKVIQSTKILGVKTTTNLGTFIQPAVDTNGVGTIYLLASSGTNINAYDPNGNLLYSFPTETSNIMSMCTDPSGNLYYTLQTGTGPAAITSMKSYQRNTYNTWGSPFTYSTQYYGGAITPIAVGAVAYNQGTLNLLIELPSGVATTGWYINIYDVGTANATNSSYFNQQSSLTNIPGLASENVYTYATSLTTLGLYDINAIAVASFSPVSFSNNTILGFEGNGNIFINGNFENLQNNSYQIVNANSATSVAFSPNYGSINLTPTTQTYTLPADSGPYDIFTYQQFLNKINEAFQSCFNELKTAKGASFLPTEAPSIVYNAQTRLFNLVVEGQYLTTNADGSNQYTIFMNDALWSKFYFPSSGKYDSIYNAIILQNYGINAVQGNGSATLPQFIYVQQEDSTIYAFYDLVRIIVGTTLIPVSGDGEGKSFTNTGFVSNNAINMITDIVPDTTILTPGSVLIYVPAGILRWYNLYAQQPFQRIDLILYYETKDGNIYTVPIINKEFFSVKLEFKKGPGDF